MPTVDHVGDGLGEAEFKICAWRTNDAKSDLSYPEFIELCCKVAEHARRTSPMRSVTEIVNESFNYPLRENVPWQKMTDVTPP